MRSMCKISDLNFTFRPPHRQRQIFYFFSDVNLAQAIVLLVSYDKMERKEIIRRA